MTAVRTSMGRFERGREGSKLIGIHAKLMRY